MYWLDTAILGLLVLAALLGAWSGFVRQLVRLVGLGVALYVSLVSNDRVTVLLQKVLDDLPEWAPRWLAYVGVFCAVWLGFFLFALLLEKSLKEAQLQWLNRMLGAAVGAFKGALLLGFTLLAGMAYLEQPANEAMQKSAWAPVLVRGARLALTAVPVEYRERFREQMSGLQKEAPLELSSLLPGGSAHNREPWGERLP